MKLDGCERQKVLVSDSANGRQVRSVGSRKSVATFSLRMQRTISSSRLVLLTSGRGKIGCDERDA